MKIKNYYCGHPGLSIENFFSNKTSNVYNWFNKNKIIYFHKARVAIKYLCDKIGVEPDDEILVPSYNCGSEIDPLYQTGAKLIVYNIKKDCSLDIKDLKNSISDKTKIIYVIHYYGFVHNLTDIVEVCKTKNIYLIEDCALSLFTKHDYKNVGCLGDAAIFSFPKTLPVPDGGALVANNHDLFSNNILLKKPGLKLFYKKLLPIIKSSILRWIVTKKINFLTILFKTKKYEKKREKTPDIPASYYYDQSLNNMKTSNLTKKLLKSFDYNDIVFKRRRNFLLFLEEFKNDIKIVPLFSSLKENVCPLNFPIFVNNREEINKKMLESNIATVSWWAGYYKNLNIEKFTETCCLKNNILALPIHHQLDVEDIKYISKKIKSLVSI
ncbi:MAG: aminotransferase class V-fold PLP-dependent enzyme [Spirochaetes bacterium]|nr:aminotransferase class V-fold PLP-dependent enzyme [Spirochaetota bacterium]